ncbi:methyltransferase domain-containing protein [Sphingomonas sp. CFBP 13720]|uniref:methyltransferase domain-containing protein n=1 Tax=Sphingomonas sp. CFBP 13720 TaxID=2775302 RepID=UPI001786C99C|nr:class I SAM-dependent methyltransferase [Sphingomonas sp. CFBP 13720]
MSKLDFGCGQTKEPGYVGMDIYPGSGVDVIHDFDVFPYPFADDSFDAIVSKSSLEHVDDVVKTVVELYRILKPGGILEVWVPHYSGPDAYRDPTHKTFFAYTTFDRFTGETSYETPHSGMFTMVQRTFGLPTRGNPLKALPKIFANRFPELYEQVLCWMMPSKTMYYKLRANKPRLGIATGTGGAQAGEQPAP